MMAQNQRNLAIGVDIGGTKIASVLVDSKGRILASDYRMTGVGLGNDESIQRIIASIENVAKGHHEICGIGIDVPGLVSPESGMVEKAVNMNWERLNLSEILQSSLSFSTPIFLQRDTFAQTLGEHYYGSAQGETDYVYLGIGSGLGAGALINGELLIGSGHAALEVGHLTLTGLTERCGCGKIGCAETLLSGPGLVRRYQSLEWNPRIGREENRPGEITTEEVVERAIQKDPRAVLLIHEFGKYLGELISDIVMVLNPAAIVIGGGLGLSAYDLFIEEVQSEIKKRCFPASYQALKITKSSLASSALGAASLVWYSTQGATICSKEEANGK